jgi:Holliday junction resolvase RusA-like endonuclease
VPFSCKSDAALQWVDDALRQIPGSARLGLGSKEQPLCISFWVRYASRRPDLSVELIMDVLQKAGVISDDRWVYETHAYKEIADDPGVYVVIEEAACET